MSFGFNPEIGMLGVEYAHIVRRLCDWVLTVWAFRDV